MDIKCQCRVCPVDDLIEVPEATEEDGLCDACRTSGHGDPGLISLFEGLRLTPGEVDVELS